MPYYDLNVPWAAGEVQLQRTIAFLDELGYDVVALSYTLSGKLPSDLSCPIPEKLSFKVPQKTQVLRRCTLHVGDPSQNHRISSLASNYDILAIRPLNEKSLQIACSSLDCDVISLDLTRRLDYHFRMKMLSQAIERGIKFEICYSPAILTGDVNGRRNFISNATQLIRATRGRGLIISSEAMRAAGCRSPEDITNLAAVWGLGQEKGKEAITKLGRHLTVSAHFKRTGYRGVVDVVYGGEKKQEDLAGGKSGPHEAQRKRKAGNQEKKEPGTKNNQANPVMAKPLSKREQKRRKKAVQQEQNQEQEHDRA